MELVTCLARSQAALRGGIHLQVTGHEEGDVGKLKGFLFVCFKKSL